MYALAPVDAVFSVEQYVMSTDCAAMCCVKVARERAATVSLENCRKDSIVGFDDQVKVKKRRC